MLARGTLVHRRDMLKWLGTAVLGSLGAASVAHPAAAETTPNATGEESNPTMPSTGVGFPRDTSRVAGLGLAAAAVLVASKLIRDKERDPEL